MSNINSNNLNDLIKQASQKTGVNSSDLKNNIDNGKLDALLAQMRPADAQRFQQVLSNPALAQQMLNSPQGQMLIKKFAQK